MKYHFSAENHACACIMVSLNGLSSANSSNNNTFIDIDSCFCHQDCLRASYGYFSGIATIPFCIMAASCICTLLRAIFFNRINKFSKD